MTKKPFLTALLVGAILMSFAAGIDTGRNYDEKHEAKMAADLAAAQVDAKMQLTKYERAEEEALTLAQDNARLRVFLSDKVLVGCPDATGEE